MINETPLAPLRLDERQLAASLIAKANNIQRWLNAASPHTRRTAKDELKKLIAEAGQLWSLI